MLQYKFFGVVSNDSVEHNARVTTAERKRYAFQRLFRSTDMRLGRVPFFLSSSQVWARPPFRPFLFAAQLKRLAPRVPDCERTNRGTPPNIPDYGSTSNSEKTCTTAAYML
jgi:hypothetical protein